MEEWKSGRILLLVTVDIKSLYTNVPFEDLVRVSQIFFNKRSEAYPSTQCILNVTNEVLTSNGCLYDNYFFSPNLRCCHGLQNALPPVGLLEQENMHYHQANPFLHYISNWRRYHDNVVFFLSGKDLTNF